MEWAVWSYRDKDAMKFVDLSPQPSTTERKAIRWVGADDVVYWVRAVNAHNPLVVGAAWHKGSPELFFAEILPP